jgi:ABC-type multidrug transport system fused ATPase/permease subunit
MEELTGWQTFVAQDPVLFVGSIRDNLDPLSEYSDTECNSVLSRVLGSAWTLEQKVEAGGHNLSQGQRQLIGLGRAILRRSPIIILDEVSRMKVVAIESFERSVVGPSLLMRV